MTGIGPVEAGADTLLQPSLVPAPPVPAARRRTTAALAALAVTALCVPGLTEPRPPAEAPPPWPTQVVDFRYGGATPAPHGDGVLSFAVLLSGEEGEPVTVEDITQPSVALSLTAEPEPPFTVRTSSTVKTIITVHVRDCGKVQRNAGLPFLDVTLRNKRAIQQQSFILGSGYPDDLTAALQQACPRNSP